MANLSGAIRNLSTGSYPVERSGPTTWANGLAVSGPSTSFTITAVIHPAGEKDLRRLPEGERSGDLIVVFTRTHLRTAEAGGGLSDRVTYQGRAYEIEDVENWGEAGDYFKAIARRVGQ